MTNSDGEKLKEGFIPEETPKTPKPPPKPPREDTTKD
jgi:hypothetical protein